MVKVSENKLILLMKTMLKYASKEVFSVFWSLEPKNESKTFLAILHKINIVCPTNEFGLQVYC